MSIINSFDSWTRLREVWLGDVYPTEWYEHLPSDIRDTFQTITEWTKEDLAKIERKLVNDFGVTVRRPQYTNIDNHIIQSRLDGTEVLQKPEITPRDFVLALGNTLYVPRWYQKRTCWHYLYDMYLQEDSQSVKIHDYEVLLSGANTVRAGRDVFVDCVFEKNKGNDRQTYFQENIVPELPDFRCHYLDNGGHVDSCFAILKPGHLLANRYFDDYDRTFPNWKRLELQTPEFANHDGYDKEFIANGRWYLPGGPTVPGAFKEHVVKYAQDWVGNYTETFFEVNCLSIDEKNVMVLGENEAVFRYLENIGITPHPMDFRCRTFWDGGLHCLTVDIRRDGGMAEYL